MGREQKSRIKAPQVPGSQHAEPPEKFAHDAWKVVEQSICSGDMSFLDEYLGSDIGSTRIASVLKAVILHLSLEKVIIPYLE